MAGGAAAVASSAALAIEMLEAALKIAPAARSVPPNKMRIDFMFIAPMLWKKMYGAILGRLRANLCRRQCRVLLRIVNSTGQRRTADCARVEGSEHDWLQPT